MGDDIMDPRKRKNGEEEEAEEEEFDLDLCLSPPSQRRPKQQPQAPPGEYPSLALSPPAAHPHSWIHRHHDQPSLQMAEETPAQTLPFAQATGGMLGSSHATAFSGSSAVPGHHQYHQLYRPQPPPPHYAEGSSSSSSSSSSALVAAGPPGDAVALQPGRGFRARRNPSQGPRGGKEETIEPPFPWATDRRAVVHSKSFLLSHSIRTISGEVHCKRCEHRETLEYDLEDKYKEVARFIAANKHLMHDRAPPEWTSPAFLTCPKCDQINSLKPVVAPKKRNINWLFMLLGQTLGCCTLEQLKYFCKHTKNHRTGAKDRVLYLTFLGICKQLEPLEMYKFDR